MASNIGEILRVGLVGPGAIGRSHARAVAAVPGLALVGICGGSAAGAEAAAPGVPWFQDLAALIAATRPDIVAIATPGGAHFEAARLALAAGCHVVVEKPLTVDPLEAARLVGLADCAGRVASTISQRRLEPAHQHLAEALARGALGRPRLIEAFVHWRRTDAYYGERPWRATVAHGGGSLMNQGIHSLDLMLWLGGPVRAVSAMAGNFGHPGLAIEDMTTATLAFERGGLGVLVTSTATPPGHPAELRLFTDRGACVLSQDRLLAWDFPGVPPPPVADPIASGASDPAAIGILGHVAQWRDIVGAIRDGRPPSVGFSDGCDAVRVAAAIHRAAAEGRRVGLAEFPARLEVGA